MVLGAPLQVVDGFKYLWLHVAADGGYERDVGHSMNHWYTAFGALQSVLFNMGLMMHVGVIVPAALYGTEACALRNAGKRKVNDREREHLRSVWDIWWECHE